QACGETGDPTMTTATTTAVAKPLIAVDFYTLMALACVATAFLGFIPTYWTPLMAGQFSAHPVVHMHGIAFSVGRCSPFSRLRWCRRDASCCTAPSVSPASRSPPF